MVFGVWQVVAVADEDLPLMRLQLSAFFFEFDILLSLETLLLTNGLERGTERYPNF
jgi:hypothetical protein